MSKKFFIPALGALLAAFWTADQILWQDRETGFCAVGSAWPRYLLVLLVLAAALLPALRRSREKTVLLKNTPALAALRIGMALCAAAAGTLFLLPAFSSGYDLWKLALGALLLVTAVWLGLRCRLGREESLTRPEANALGGTAAALSLYVLTLERFVAHQTGLARVGATMSIFSAVAALLLAGYWLRLAYLPNEASPRGLYLRGVPAFLLCTCLELPQSLCQARFGLLSPAELLCSLGLALFGLAGLLAAVQSGSQSRAEAKE